MVVMFCFELKILFPVGEQSPPPTVRTHTLYFQMFARGHRYVKGGRLVFRDCVSQMGTLER